jgi:hypothetical protein
MVSIGKGDCENIWNGRKLREKFLIIIILTKNKENNELRIEDV